MYERRRTNETDDYEFLDEDEDLEDDDVMGVTSPNTVSARRKAVRAWRRRGKRDTEVVEAKVDPESIRSEFHVVFRRKDSHLQHDSDYRECHLVLFSFGYPWGRLL